MLGAWGKLNGRSDEEMVNFNLPITGRVIQSPFKKKKDKKKKEKTPSS
jgi:hypothetical protein